MKILKVLRFTVKTLCIVIVALLTAGGCDKSETVTQNFYVFNVDRDEQCGYLLFEDRGTPSDYHNFFMWTKNLPKEYQEHLLPVTVTFRHTEEKCSSYPIIDIIKIQKQ